MGLSLGGALGGFGVGSLLNTGIGSTIGGVFGSGLGNSLFGMKQYDATSNSFGSRNPYGALQPQLDYSLSQARNIYDQGVNPWITQANQMQAQTALGGGGLTGQAEGLVSSTLNGDYLNPESNPYLKSAVQDALGLAGSAFASQYGGPAGQNLGNSGYQEALGRALGATATNAYSNAYGQERQNQMAALPFAPNLDYVNSNALYNAGIQQQQAPWANLAAYQAAFSPSLNYGTTTGTNTQPFFENRTAETLGALLGGGMLASGFMRPGSTAAQPSLSGFTGFGIG